MPAGCIGRRRRWALAAATALALFTTNSSSAGPKDEGAAPLIRLALAAQGGEARLRAVRSVRWRAVGYRSAVEQSERPEGPYLIETVELSGLHQPDRGRIELVGRYTMPSIASYTLGIAADRLSAMRVTDAGLVAGGPETPLVAREAAALSPERLLLTASEAPDLTVEARQTMQSVAQDVVRFTLDGGTVRIWLNAYTHLPTAVDYDGPLARDGYWRFLGDVRMRTLFSLWSLTPQGVRMPLQRDVSRNGLPDTTLTMTALSLDGPLRDGDFRPLLAEQAGPGAGSAKPSGFVPVELDPGVTLLEGAWNVAVVDQPDGVVILEAPISSDYTTQVLDWVGKRYPGKRIKAVVSTSDAWPHVAGVREYVARGIPIYCLDLNVGQIDRFLANPHRAHPDTLATKPRPPELHPLDGRTSIGYGANRLEIYPLRGETSERQLMVYLPGRRLLYGSDPFQRSPGGVLGQPQTVGELVDAVAREALHPATFFMMHVTPADWSEAIEAARARAG